MLRSPIDRPSHCNFMAQLYWISNICLNNKLIQKFILSFHSAVRMQLNTTEQDGLEAIL
jgi:hypothetical protein